MDIPRLMSLQAESARDPVSELARILAYSAPGGTTDGLGAALGVPQQPGLGQQGMAQQPQMPGQGMGAYPNPMQGQAQQTAIPGVGLATPPYGWGQGY